MDSWGRKAHRHIPMTNGSIPRPAVQVTRHSGSLRVAIVFVAIGAVALILPMVPRVDRVALAVVMPVTMVLYLTLRREQKPLDLLEVFLHYSLFQIMISAVGALYLTYAKGKLIHRSASLEPFLTAALALVVVGYLFFTAGYGLCFRDLAPSRIQGLRPKKLSAFLLPGVLGFMGYLGGVGQERVFLSGQGISAVFSTLQQFIPFFLFAWSLVWQTFWNEPKRHLRHWLPLAFFIPMVLAVIYLTVGGKELTITLIAFPALAYLVVRRSLPWKTVLLVFLISIFVIFPIYNTYRVQSRNLDTAERLDRTLRVAQRWDTEAYLDRSIQAFLGRMAMITSTAAILRDTGRWVDFKYGDTLILAPIGVLIPRILWPDKPSIVIGREFGATFQLVNESDRETSIAISAVGEFYWNFHIPGVLIGMFLLGAGYRWYYLRYGSGTAYDPIRKSIYLALLTQTFAVEGNVAAFAAGFIKTLIMLSVLLFFLRRIDAVSYAGEEQGVAEPAAY